MNVCMLALMVLAPSHSVPITGEPCLSSGYTRAWNELLHPAAIAKNDTRYGLRVGGPKSGLSKAETEWLSKVTGNVICPGNKELMKGSQGSGALIGRNDLIVTNSHVVRSKDGSSRDDWDRCYFETQSQPPVRRKLKFFAPGTIFGTRTPKIETGLDYALIRLDEPILGVEPIPISSTVSQIKKDQPLLVVSAYQSEMKTSRGANTNEAIVQRCSARDLFAPDSGNGLIIFTDCSSTHGASGSITLTRDEQNHLVGIGIISQGASATLNGKEYSPVNHAGNYTVHLMFDGPFAKDLQESLGVQSGL